MLIPCTPQSKAGVRTYGKGPAFVRLVWRGGRATLAKGSHWRGYLHETSTCFSQRVFPTVVLGYVLFHTRTHGKRNSSTISNTRSVASNNYGLFDEQIDCGMSQQNTPKGSSRHPPRGKTQLLRAQR